MTCHTCMVHIPDCLYDEHTNEYNVRIRELECCITCMHSELDEYAKMLTQDLACLKVYCKEHETYFDASGYCDEHITQDKYDDIQEFKKHLKLPEE